MSAPITARIIASDVLCAIGRGGNQVWASARAGIGRITSSHVMDRHFEAIQMGLVPEDALAPLPPELDVLPLPARARRMLRLAAPVLSNVAKTISEQAVPIFIGLPQQDEYTAKWLPGFNTHLCATAGIQCDVARSQIFPLGRAASLRALQAALHALASNPQQPVIVGGVDTFLDLRLLAELDAEQRILGSHVMDGFIPGEGAAFMLLSADTRAQGITILGAAAHDDPGHRYGTEPAKGEGLAHALTQLRDQLGDALSPIASTFAGFNGESFEAKLWGVARLRHNDLFTPDMNMQHPADCYGDAGAATGAILTVLAATALAKTQRVAPALVWAASDHETRACAVLST
jgi:3-oxoacyl-[acyl-carrier-protein] synthase I